VVIVGMTHRRLAELFGTILAWSFLACVFFFALIGLLIAINLRQFSRACPCR
jgi:hypothetical protein